MLGTLMRRVTVKTLDVVVDRGKASDRAPVRIVARTLDRARAVIGLDQVQREAPLPDWTREHPERPMWDSDRQKLEKWRVDQGIQPRPDDQAQAQAQTKAEKKDKKSKRLPVINMGVHPEQSPFENLAVDAEAQVVSELLEGDALIAMVEEVLDECRPLVQADGGDIELLDVQSSIVHVQLTGNCVGCPSSQATLRQGIERRLKARIPQIERLASPQLDG